MSLSPIQLIPRPRICFLAHRHLAFFAAPVIAEYSHLADIELVEGILDIALSIARAKISAGTVDIFITAGTNAVILRENLQAPVAVIRLDGFSLMQALVNARNQSTRVGVVMYRNAIPELDSVKDLLKLEVIQYPYETIDDVQICFEKLKQDGVTVVIGSALIVEMAESHGLLGVLGYSLDGLRRGFDEALKLAKIAQREVSRYQQLNDVLSHLRDAVLTVDKNHCITAINPLMQQLLGKDSASLSGHPLDLIAPELSLMQTLEKGEEEGTQVLRFAQRDWLANRTAIREYGEIVGAALTLYNTQTIAEADIRLRIQQRNRQVAAKYKFTDLIGNSATFMRTVQAAQRFSQTDHTILIRGESGTGKELFAQAIHNESARSEQPFIALNCAAFPESLLESELFGYEEGAFTGSRRGGKRGLFEAAHKGTLFLDEIGDMPISLQTRLLRVLQEREITRVGGLAAIPIDVRIIAATHQSLEEMMVERKFRKDLYYRINTLRLSLPPLRERRDDIPQLAYKLGARALKRLNCPFNVQQVLKPLLPYLHAHAWPGNVRELENIIDRIAVFVHQFPSQEEINYAGLQEDCPELFFPVEIHTSDDSSFLKSHVKEMIKLTKGNRSLAAQKLGISRSTLWRWMKELESEDETET